MRRFCGGEGYGEGCRKVHDAGLYESKAGDLELFCGFGPAQVYEEQVRLAWQAVCQGCPVQALQILKQAEAYAASHLGQVFEADRKIAAKLVKELE